MMISHWAQLHGISYLTAAAWQKLGGIEVGSGVQVPTMWSGDG